MSDYTLRINPGSIPSSLLLGAGGGALFSRKGKRWQGAAHGAARMGGMNIGGSLGALAGGGLGYGLGRGGMALAEAMGATPKLNPDGAHNAGLIGALALGAPALAYGAYKGWGAGRNFAERTIKEKAPWETNPEDDDKPEEKSEKAEHKKEKSANIVGMTYDPEHPNVQALKKKHPQNWRQVMAESQGLKDVHQVKEKTATQKQSNDMWKYILPIVTGALGGGAGLYTANRSISRDPGPDGKGEGAWGPYQADFNSHIFDPESRFVGPRLRTGIATGALGGAALGATPLLVDYVKSKLKGKDPKEKEKTAMHTFEFGFKVAQSMCSPCDMPNSPTNKKHMTSASPAVLDASQKSEEIGKPQTTETEHSEAKAKQPEEGVKSAAYFFGFKVAEAFAPPPPKPLARQAPTPPKPVDGKADPLPPRPKPLQRATFQVPQQNTKVPELARK